MDTRIVKMGVGISFSGVLRAGCYGLLLLNLPCRSQVAEEDYPGLPWPWQYMGTFFDRNSDGGKTQSNFFLDRREIYTDCPGYEILNAGHHGGTHMAVQYRTGDGQWHWRPALYADLMAMPEYPPIADSLSGCYFLGDPENPGSYFVEYQRSDADGAHAVFYLSPRPVQGPDQQPFDGNPLLTMRRTRSGPGDPICKAGMWGLPAPFVRGDRKCLLLLPNGHRMVELPDCIWSTYPVVMDREPGEQWTDAAANDYQLIWTDSAGHWIPLRWNAVDILGGAPSPGDVPGLQASAAVFQYESGLYMLVIGGATKYSADWVNPTSRGFIFLYRFLGHPGFGPDPDYRVERIKTIVDPKDNSPNSAANVGGYLAGAIRPLLINLGSGSSAPPSFVIGLTRLATDNMNRWKFDFGSGPQFVSGGFAVLEGFRNPDGCPDFNLIPPRPDTARDYPHSYGMAVIPGEEGDDVVFKTGHESGFYVVRVPNRMGQFDLSTARILLDTDSIAPSQDWEMNFFSSCFIGLFPAEGSSAGYDMVIPLTVQRKGLTQDHEELRYTYISRPVESANPSEVGHLSDGSKVFQLEVMPNFPNPFNGRTVFSLRLRKDDEVEWAVFNASGREIHRSKREMLQAGMHHFTVHAEGWGSGVYFLSVRGSGGKATGKLLVIK